MREWEPGAFTTAEVANHDTESRFVSANLLVNSSADSIVYQDSRGNSTMVGGYSIWGWPSSSMMNTVSNPHEMMSASFSIGPPLTADTLAASSPDVNHSPSSAVEALKNPQRLPMNAVIH